MQPFSTLHNTSKKYFYLTSGLNLFHLAFIKGKDDTALSDTELVELYRGNGDLAVLSLLYQRYMDLVYGICIKYLKDAETAKDAVINIYEELIPKLKQHEVANFKSWLYTLSRNHCLMQLRTKERAVEIPPSR